jgi:hypothetical protein
VPRYNIYILDGERILQEYYYKMSLPDNNDLSIIIDEEVILSCEQYNCNAFLWQMLSLLKKDDEKIFENSDALTQQIVYIDFKSAMMAANKECFFDIIQNGLEFRFAENFLDEKGKILPSTLSAPIRFVPFEKSNSQARNCVMSFIKEDLFAPLRPILDLDLELEAHNGQVLSSLSKLYAYRGLYFTDATLIATAKEPKFSDFFTKENIIVIDDINIIKNKKDGEKDKNQQVKVYTAKQGENYTLTPEEKLDFVNINCFDGEGLISPSAAKMINDRLGKTKAADQIDLENMNTSFQVRMPFFKGMLHCVDFNKFLSEIGIGEKEDAFVEDVFGIKRNLRKANVIATKSMLKLCSLDFKKVLGDLCADPIEYYFEKLKYYNHGFYLAKTEENLHNNGYSHLTYQILNTLDLKSEVLDELIDEHIKNADTFSYENLARQNFINDELLNLWQDKCMKLIAQEPLFINDEYIESQIDNYRLSKYKEIATGTIDVKGETRFLSCDLLYFLYRLAKGVEKQQDLSKETVDELENVKAACNKNCKVYIPNAKEVQNKVALFRSPHLSRNEDVCAKVFNGNNYYTTYLSHLKGVVMVGYNSYIPAALGGADFDGDTISIIYDNRIVTAVLSGYAEGQNVSLPFIDIKPLENRDGGSTAPKTNYKYVHPEVIWNTFNSRVGQISNAALKIAAVEYNKNLDAKLPFSAALCTILTGNEIDAAKKGIRPNIDSVVSFAGQNKAQKEIVKKITNYLNVSKVLESWGARAPKVLKNGEKLTVLDKEFAEFGEFAPNRNLSPVCGLIYRWALLFAKKDETKKPTAKERTKLLSNLWESTLPCPKAAKEILLAHKKVCSEYSALLKTKMAAKNQPFFISRLKTLLKQQYDNIYFGDFNSPNAKYVAAQHALNEIISDGELLSYDDFTAIFEKWFSSEKSKFNPETFWPFFCAEKREELDKAFKGGVPNSEIFKSFEFGGYKLLNYALNITKKSAVFSKKIKDAEDTVNKSEFVNLFLPYKLNCIKKSVSKNQFKLTLADVAKKEIFALFPQDAKKSEIIKSVYLSLGGNGRKAFWQVFSVGDILNILEGTFDA